MTIRRINIFWLLIIVFALGVFLRLYKLDEGLIFSYDQARDAYRTDSIIKNKDFKVLGPETDIPGVFHGVGYYYLLSLPYAFFKSPLGVGQFHAVLNLIGIPIIYFASQSLFGKKRLSFLAALLFAVSYEFVQYARWLSNPSFAVITSLIMFWMFWEWINHNSQLHFIIGMTALALSLHFQLFLLYLYLWPLFIYFVYKPHLTVKTLIISCLTSGFILSTFLLAELKFHFQMTQGLINHLINQTSDYASITTYALRYVDRFVSVYYNSVGPFNTLGIFLLLLFLFSFYLKKVKQQVKPSNYHYVLYWMLSSFPLFAFASGAVNSEFSFIGVASSFIIFTAVVIDMLLDGRQTRLLGQMLIIIFVVSNVLINLKNTTTGSYLYTLRRPVTYALEKKVIDFTYANAHGEEFTICTLTNPLFYNTVWSYLYETYGQQRYNYLPYWSGQLQPADMHQLQNAKEKTQIRYLIYEPNVGIPGYAFDAFRALENFVSNLDETITIGEFKVEKRRLLTTQERDAKRALMAPYDIVKWESGEYSLFRCF